MKIRKLEVQGFKSFVDRTVLTFDHDVTAIVGPNGCGKSNTVDAIRWCMGEQSARHLRGKSMDDVIFAGSESRPAHSYAEVTLTFDNRDGLAPPEYANYDEVAVTRRLGRDGASEYMINKTPVRLMDVVGLFLGTGAGTKAYSIVEQGRIGLIVTSKPEDRRGLLEEAAGITRYKARRKLAEKKIEQTRQNLLRVGDILTEIDKSLATLKRQAQKAERYKSYRAELRDIELYIASHRLLELVAVSRVTTAALETAEAQFAGYAAALARVEAEGAQLRTALFDAEQKLEAAQQSSFQADNEVKRLEAQTVRLRDQINAARKRETDASRELVEIAAQRELLARERDELASELVAIAEGEERAAGELATAEDRVRDMRDRLDDVEAQLAVHRAAVVESEKVLAGAEASRNALSRRLLEGDALRARLEGEARSLRKRQSEIRDESSGVVDRLAVLAAERDELVIRRARLESDQGPLRVEREAMEKRLGEARVERDRASARLHALREVAGRHEGVGQGVRAVLGWNDAGVRGLVADAMAVPADLAPAVAAVLADRWQDVRVDEPERAIALVDRLRRENKGRAAMVGDVERRAETVAPHPEAPGIVGMLVDLIGGEREVPASLLRAMRPVVLADSLEAAIAAWRARGPGYVYVTRQGDVLDDGRVVGGTPEQAGAGLLATHAEIRSLEPRVFVLEAETTELTAALDTARQKVRDAQRELEETRADLHAQELALVSLEGDVKTHEADKQRIAARLETLTLEIERADAQFASAEEEDRALDVACREANEKREGAREGLIGAESESQAWRSEVDRANARLTDTKVVAARARERATAARNTVARLERSAQELGAREQRLEAEIAELARTQGTAAGQFAVMREGTGAAVYEAQRLADELRNRRVAYDSLRVEQGDAEGSARAVRQRKDQLAKQVTAFEMRAREEVLATEHLVDAMAERHQVVLPHVVGDYHLRAPPDDALRARGDELRSLIDRMGEVNLTAIDEYAQQEKRGAFFAEQKADIEGAVAQLEEAIAQMDKESRRRFRETFDAVNLHFQKLFPRLFRGGRGSLTLSNPDDMLDTGVEIVAQPPGKKLVNLEAMSGGEKTLTAVTLLFALFMHRPSPFCLLDEVEAALDEANVIRLCDLVRDLTEHSQFIMITHNKRTMSMADVLYGVTMEEPGVSKLVGVKLRQGEGAPVLGERTAVA